MKLRMALLAIFVAGSSHLSCYAQEALRIGFPIDLSFDGSKLISDQAGKYESTVVDLGQGDGQSDGKRSGFLRLRIDSVRLPPGAKISIYDQSSNLIQEFLGPLEISKPQYSYAILTTFAKMTLEGANPSDIGITIGRAYVEQEISVPNSVFGPDDRQKIQTGVNDSQFDSAIKAISFLSLIQDGEFKVCSAFKIAKDAFMTNEHCIGTQEICDTTVVIQNYQISAAGDLQYGPQARCKKKIISDPDLDFSVFTVESGALPDGGNIKLSEAAPLRNEPAVLIQHPGGEPKQFSVKGCSVLDVDVDGRVPSVDFTHRCDTLGGSSGSPVLVSLANGNSDPAFDCARGLHHFGFDDPPFEDYNRAVEMSKIVSFLRKKDTDLKFEVCE